MIRPSGIINFIVLACIALSAYGLTLFLDSRQPKIIVQPEAPVETVINSATLPDFEFRTPNGNTHKSTDFNGKVVILNFWASWCAPCIKEFPHFIKATQNFTDDVVFIGLSSDIDEAAMLRFLEKIDADATAKNMFIALDSENLTQKIFQTYRLPETILIDRHQIMRTKIIGADWTYEDLEKQLKDLLSE